MANDFQRFVSNRQREKANFSSEKIVGRLINWGILFTALAILGGVAYMIH